MSRNASIGRCPAAAQNWGEPKAGQSRTSTTPPVGSMCSEGPEQEDEHQAQPERGQRVEDVAEQGQALVERE